MQICRCTDLLLSTDNQSVVSFVLDLRVILYPQIFLLISLVFPLSGHGILEVCNIRAVFCTLAVTFKEGHLFGVCVCVIGCALGIQ